MPLICAHYSCISVDALAAVQGWQQEDVGNSVPQREIVHSGRSSAHEKPFWFPCDRPGVGQPKAQVNARRGHTLLWAPAEQKGT